MAASVSIDVDVHRPCHTDGIADLHQHFVGHPGCHHVLGDVACGVCGRTVYFGRVFPGEGASAVGTFASVSVHDDFTAGQSGIAMRTAYHEFAGGVHVVSDMFVKQPEYGRIVNLGNDTRHQNRNDILAYLVQHLPVGLFLLAVGRLDKFVMLCGNHNRVHADRFPVVVIFNRHLAFGVGTQISHFFAFAPYFGQYTQDFVAEVEG